MPEQEMSFEDVKRQCIFCHIVSGQVQSKKVYEDEKVVAVLDINPANPGHVLIIPKEHYAIMPQIPDDEIGYVGMMAKALSAAVLRAFKSQGTTIFIANGVVAGQRAQHFMAHVIPRMDGDALCIELPENKVSQAQLNEVRAALTPSIKRHLGSVVDIREADEQAEEKSGDAQEEKKSLPKMAKKKDHVDLDSIAGLLSS